MYFNNSELDIYGNLKHEMLGLLANIGKINIEYSVINIDMLDGNYGCVGIDSYKDSLLINTSKIDINMNDGKGIKMEGYEKIAEIKNSNLVILIDNINSDEEFYNHGIFSYYDISIDNTSLDINLSTKKGRAIMAYNNITLSNIKECNINVNESMNGNGIYSDAIVNIIDSRAIINASTEAIVVPSDNNLLLDNDGDTLTRIVEASETYKQNISEYEDADLEKYIDKSLISNDSKQYKYVKLGEVATYYLQYDATANKLYKVSATSDTTDITDTVDAVKGINVDKTNKMLVLDGLDFITTAAQGIEVVGEATIQVNNNNSIDIIEYTNEYVYGIKGNNNLIFNGKGTLDLSYINDSYSSSNQNYNGVYTTGDINITDTTFNIIAKEYMCYGIQGKSITEDTAINKMNITAVEGAGLQTPQDKESISLTNCNVFIETVGTSKEHVTGIYSYKDLTIQGGSIECNVNNTNVYNDAIYSNSNMIIDSAKVNATTNGSQYSAAIYSNADLSITKSEILAINSYTTNKNNKDGGNGIYTEKNLSITTSNVVAKGISGAISFDNNTNSTPINGSIIANESYDETGTEITDLETYLGDPGIYLYVKITGKIFSVDITWGNLDYTYTEGTWEPVNHSYTEGTWETTDKQEGSDKITIENKSNVDVNANISYISESGYKGIIGTLVDDKDNKEVISASESVLAGNSFNAYLILSGRLSSDAKNTKIGTVTVTISE